VPRYLKELDNMATVPVRLDCIGGLVVTMRDGLRLPIDAQ
jgi:hypothetical protein